MKKILLATILALGLTTVSADTVCQVTNSIPTYETVMVRTPTKTSYEKVIITRVKCGSTMVDLVGSNDMKLVPKYCNGTYTETRYRTGYTTKAVKQVKNYKNYFVYKGIEYIKTSDKKLDTVLVQIND